MNPSGLDETAQLLQDARDAWKPASMRAFLQTFTRGGRPGHSLLPYHALKEGEFDTLGKHKSCNAAVHSSGESVLRLGLLQAIATSGDDDDVQGFVPAEVVCDFKGPGTILRSKVGRMRKTKQKRCAAKVCARGINKLSKLTILVPF